MRRIKEFLGFIVFILTQDISLFYRKYFVNFIEEFWPGVEDNTIVARVEIRRSITGDGIKEVRIYTKNLSRYHRLREKYDFKHITKKELLQLEKEIRFLNTKSYSIGYDYRYSKGLSIQLDDNLYALRCPHCKKEQLDCLDCTKFKTLESSEELMIYCKRCKYVLDIDDISIGRKLR